MTHHQYPTIRYGLYITLWDYVFLTNKFLSQTSAPFDVSIFYQYFR